MELTIVKESINYINDCEEALVNYELGRRYFSEKGSALKALEEGFAKEKKYIAIDNNNSCKFNDEFFPKLLAISSKKTLKFNL